MKQVIYSFLMGKGFQEKTLDLLTPKHLVQLAKKYSFKAVA